ncbi:MAG TPA: ATP-dependent RecD-like DNA helicase [Spirochaetia bacterium]|nr:ATP-dependent RecD-like DNA helicase [Spirochaetia bacterium]
MRVQADLFDSSELVTIEGTLERVRYASEDDDWSVVVLDLAESGGEATAVGNLAGVQAGESLRLTGRWTRHPKFGRQFKVDSFSAVPPATAAGIEHLLRSGLIEGIGKELASRLVARFGARTLEVIEKEPKKLREVEGVGPQRAQRLVDAWARQRSVREIVYLLQSCGVSTGLATRIFTLYGNGAHEMVRRNPWRLAEEMPGVGFRTADAIAKSLGVAPDSPQRIEAGVLFALEQRAEEGDVMASQERIVRETAESLSLAAGPVAAAIESLASRGAVIQEQAATGEVLLGLNRLVRAEQEAARRLAAIAREKRMAPGLERDSLSEIVAFEAKAGVALSPIQKQAVLRATMDKILVITGGPGTGKTTIVTAIIRILEARGIRVALCAPTGRAAKRMSEATGREARTIHRLLEYSPQQGRFLRTHENPLACDALIVDETSMIDVTLFNRLLEAAPTSASLIFVGDADQLPSVGPGSVLADLIASKAVPVVRLTDIFRQARSSAIVVNAHRINDGLMPFASADEEIADFFFIERAQPEAIMETIREVLAVRIPRRFGLDPRRDIQVLTPMRRGLLGTRNMNRELQALLNPHGRSLARGTTEFRVGDRVMQTSNNYELGVFNGDIGTIDDVHPEQSALVARFDERVVRYEWSALDELEPAYACSIHKSQGSEFPGVVIALHTQHYVLLRRNLLYTAVTRGKKLAVIVGSTKALAIAVKSTGSSDRCTRLAERLRHAMEAEG